MGKSSGFTRCRAYLFLSVLFCPSLSGFRPILSILGPSWPQLGSSWSHKATSWSILAPSWTVLATSVGPSRPILAHLVSSRLHLGVILVPSWPTSAPSWTTVAPSWPRLFRSLAISFCSFCPVRLCPTSCPTPPTLCAVISSGAGGPNGFAVRIRPHRPLWPAAWGVSRRYFRHMTVMS